MSDNSPVKYRSMFLFLFTGCFVLLTVSIILREAMARFENPLLTATLTLFFLSMWTAVGGMFFSRGEDREDEREGKSFILTGALIFLPPTALISVLSAMFFPLPSTLIISGLPSLLLCTAFSTLWIGLFCGLIMALVFSLKNSERIGSELSYCVGLIVGGAAFPLLSSHLNSPPAVIALAGVMVIIPAIFSGMEHFKSRGFKALLWVMASCALLLDAGGVYASQKLFQIYWSKSNPGWSMVKNLNTPTGKITVLKKTGLSPELLVLDNGAPLWRVPQDSQKHISGMLPTTLQLDSGNLQALVIGSPFSRVPHFLLALPHVAEVTLLCPYRELIAMAAGIQMLPMNQERFFIASMPPEDFLMNTSSKYDVIMILEPSFISNSGNEQIYRLASTKLTPNGIVVAAESGAASPENSAADSLSATLKTQFSQTMQVPGCKLLTMAGNRKLTADLNELDNRLSRLSSYRDRMLPRGVLSTLYSLPEEDNAVNPDSLLSETFKEKLQKNVIQPPPLPVILLAVFCLAAYVVTRLFMSRTGNYALGFGAFENGFFIMGLFILLLIAYQQDKGDLYQKIPVFLGMLGGVGFGRVFLRVPHFKTVMAAISCLCPLLLYFNDLDIYYSILLGSIFCMAISAGMAEEILSSRVTLMKPESLAVLRYCGHTCGIVFFPLILLQSNGILYCVILLLLFRLPLLFSTAPYQGKS